MSKLKVRGQPKYTEPEVQAMFPPQFWEFTKSPWYFGLAVKIFRRDPQLAPNVAEVMTDPSNVPISRAAMKRNKQLLRHSPKTRSASNPSTATSLLETPRRNDGMLPTTLFSAGRERVSDPSSTKRARVVNDKQDRENIAAALEEKKKLVWAKVALTKATVEQSNLAKRLGKMKELQSAMEMFKEMRHIIGEEAYATKIRGILASVPDFSTFDAAVEAAAPNVDFPVAAAAQNVIMTTPAFTEQADAEDAIAQEQDDDDGHEELRNHVNVSQPTILDKLLPPDGDKGDYLDDDEEEFEAAIRKEQRPCETM
jgi:hypothetical protein